MSLKSISSPFARSLANADLRSAFFSFTLTRVIVFAVVVLAANAQPEGKGPAFGGQVEEVKIYVQQHGLIGWLGESIAAGDALWYLDVAQHGYEKEQFNIDRQHNWAFFPLYPLIVSLAAKVTGEFVVTAAVLSNIFFLGALIIFHRLASTFGADPEAANRSVFYLAAFPTSYFFSFPFTESLFLLLTLSSFYFAKRDRWWLAGVMGALASATRLAGLFLLPALAILYWQQHRARPLRPRLLSLLLIPAGLIAFMLYLRSITGNAFAFVDIQSAWGHNLGFFLRPMWDYVKSPMLLGIHWDFRILNFVMVVVAFGCCGVLIKRRQGALAIYMLLSLLVPLSSNFSLQSLTRYVMVMFPVFIVLGDFGRFARLDQIIRAIFVALLSVMTALFALHVALAMA
jgi:Mannosyltransferase (PIG-V)